MAKCKFEVLMPDKCTKCLHFIGTVRDKNTWMCGFMLRTGHMRESSAKDCDKFTLKTAADDDESSGSYHPPHHSRNYVEKRRKMYLLYEKGYNDRQIAEAMGCSSGTVWQWRNKAGLPTQAEKKKNLPSEDEEKGG